MSEQDLMLRVVTITVIVMLSAMLLGMAFTVRRLLQHLTQARRHVAEVAEAAEALMSSVGDARQELTEGAFGFLDQSTPFVESMTGFKKQMIDRGWSESVAEDMVLEVMRNQHKGA